MKKFSVGYIYLVRNLKNNKCYVGQTLGTVEDRWKGHCKGARANDSRRKSVVSRAINKYGAENFSVETLGTFTAPLLNTAERRFIKDFNSCTPYGYNCTTGGDSGGKASKATRRKLSLAHKGKVLSKAQRKRMCEAQQRLIKDKAYTKRRGESLRAKWAADNGSMRKRRSEAGKAAWTKERSEAQKLKWKDPKYRDRCLAGFRRTYKDPIYLAANSARGKALWKTSSFKKKMTVATKTRWKNPEAHKVIANAQIRRFSDPHERELQGQRQRKRFEDPRERAKISKAVKLQRRCATGQFA